MQAKPKLDYINAVRGIAILLVILLHVSRAAVKGLPETFAYICAKGSYGVQLFFVASAFTLYISYSNRINIEGKNTNRNFFIRRFFRISPMYYLAAVVYAVLCYYIPHYNDGKPLVIWKVLANIFYINDFVPGAINYLPPGGWSVGVEMLFYLCLPFLFSKIKNIKIATAWFLISAAGAIVLKLVIRYMLIRLSINYQKPESWFLYFWFPNQFPVFFLGIILFYALQKYVVKSAVVIYVAFAVSTFLLMIISYFMPVIDPYNILPEHIIVATFFTINIFLLAQHNIKIFNNRLTRFLGEISFSLYLIHFLVIYLLADYFPLPVNPYLSFITLLALTITIGGIISKITYHGIELKGIKLGNRFIHKNATISKAKYAIFNPGETNKLHDA
ncbi:Peptidoglycan/LPS O-acetylase OafA/YrhL, contains acyltransferase and SGNH-hydrolase domains [Mucilaginibacter mallensis]|uniref:Peptidoglycan/LPS O-acetylase OafA/YrhL, contains acyltransferase and SGNH-hydrolase domains n=1 Tax=Mucilaginibacter mallensis TaxID=652787 RepID=A0A1H1QZU1_MUCMA|nr:acyltransferase [Mucilaginibacter mallensis]SDS28785.1 Peptidoglycan/LPS O-acetylase OafA/YrhL, contains acyltransferase and SGNH-hydrolase domains [Mucilaginibacter mallensis]